MEKQQLVNKQIIHATFSYGVIYVYSIPGDQHKGRLKIGSATLNSSAPTQEEIEAAAHGRIRQQTKTADISYRLEYATLGLTEESEYLSDHTVHNVLIRSGFDRKSENTKNLHSEWFEIDLATAKSAIQVAKEGRAALSTKEKLRDIHQHFDFRPNQLDAIEKTNKAIRQKRKYFLWNAKMRFGKTSTAMQVAKENNFQKILIVTHRPSVSKDWYDDFNKVFNGTDYQFSSKTRGEELHVRLSQAKPFVYFASLQDLRLSEAVVSDGSSGSSSKGFKKNDRIFDTTWDMLIVDEAHEGTQSSLGDATISKIPTNFKLELSGTPFNILHKHEEDNIYTWDYVMEQRDKLNWDEEHPGMPNPYAELPALSMFTYDVDTFGGHIGPLEKYTDALDGAFRFHEFFRVQKDGDGNDQPLFVHEAMVKRFIDLLADDTLKTKFPYSTEEYGGYIKHSLWLLPNRTKVIEAMEKLLKGHPVFGKFGIVNISGNAHQDDEADKDAKERVTRAITDNEYTITLTGQRLTTGASVPEWTAVFMLSDTSSATTYLQTAFRCQTPAKIDGKLKTQGYIFDFAPDRTLKLVAEAIELNHKSGRINSPEQKEAMKEFLNFCPILAAKGGSMQQYNVSSMLEQLKKAIIERVSRNGFDDPKLYNDELMQLDELAIEEFNKLKALVGAASQERINEIEVNNLGMTDLQREKADEAERKKKQKKPLTDEEKELQKKLNEAREQKKSAISILRGVSIRMPMLVYGASISVREQITLDKFIDIVDDESWFEFMPTGLTKDKFREFTKYYDEEVFRGVAHSIRAKAFDCDGLPPTERVQAIAELFSTFKNPDKETVLTPWNVVNMQMSLTLGGHDFRTIIKEKPEWVTKGDSTKIWSQDDVRILEINSKSGLYPLLAAYNIYSRQLIKQKKPEEDIHQRLWNDILSKNIFVICKSPMAKTITERTLAGYTKTKMNVVYIHDLIKKLKQIDENRGYNLKDELSKKFEINGEKVKFAAVVGNPPYQQTNSDRNRDDAIYHLFIEESYKLADKVSLITPARFLFNVGSTPSDWNKKMLSDEHLKVAYFEQRSGKVFPNTDIKGGVVITYRDANAKLGPIGVFTSSPELSSILLKVEAKNDQPEFGSLMFVQNKLDLDKLYSDYPEFKSKLGSGGKEKRLTSAIFDVLPEIFWETQQSNDFIGIYGRLNNERVYRYVLSKYIEKSGNLLKYKVFVPAANGSGEFGESLSKPIVGKPGVGHTQTFISIGAFETEFEAVSMHKYLCGKFARTMLGILKTTHNNKTKDVWSKIPLQDFTKSSDIDWSRPISEIDKQLYSKYSLNQSEVDFIETRVKAMG